MKNIALVVNSTKDPTKNISKKIISFIESYGCNCTGCIYTKKMGSLEYEKINVDEISSDTELVLSIGGDGTFLHASKDLIDLNIPIMGINMGHLGYLTEVNIDGFTKEFKHILEGEYHITDRMLLKGSIIRSGKVIQDDIAVNDIVLNRIGSMNIINFDVYVNNNFLNSYLADGYIICSPTGSTGYNLSSGGPVAHPNAEVIIATPICAHTLNSRSVIFSADAVIDVVVRAREDEERQIKVVSFDGSGEIVLQNNDIIRIEKSEKVLKNLRLDKTSFIEHLGKKMR